MDSYSPFNRRFRGLDSERHSSCLSCAYTDNCYSYLGNGVFCTPTPLTLQVFAPPSPSSPPLLFIPGAFYLPHVYLIVTSDVATYTATINDLPPIQSDKTQQQWHGMYSPLTLLRSFLPPPSPPPPPPPPPHTSVYNRLVCATTPLLSSRSPQEDGPMTTDADSP